MKTRFFLPIKFLYFLVVSTIILAGCAIPGIIYQDTNWEGPIIYNNSRAKVVEKCDFGPSGISDVTYCKRAFIDHDGNKIDVTEDVRDKIDNYLMNVTPLVPWVKQTITVQYPTGFKHTYTEAKVKSRLPYRLHILTISPLVILAVPDEDNREYCERKFNEGCFPSKKLDFKSYWYKCSPNVRDGSFWFSPTLDIPIQYISNHVQTYKIHLPDSFLELKDENSTWIINRRF